MKRLNRVLIPIIIIVYLNLSSLILICSTNSNQIVKRVKTAITLKVLLVEFTDVKHRSPEYPANLALPAYTYDDFNNMLFSENKYWSPNMFSPDGKEVFGSLRDYYRIMSNNNLEINGYILNKDLDNDNVPDWITLYNSKEFYHNQRGKQFRDEAKYKATMLGLDVTKDESTYLVIIYAGHTYRNNTNGCLNPEAFFKEHEYIMGERFASCYPYEEERDDPSVYPVSHFAHIGIHAHEFCHLLGFSDLKGGLDNKSYCLMSSGNFNGPNIEGSCPAPMNPYFRFKLGWISIETFDKSYTANLKYDISNPEVYQLQDNSSSSFFLVEFRKLDSKIRIGNVLMHDYNSYIKNTKIKHGLLVWRKLTGDFLALLHSCGNPCDSGEHCLFPGISSTNVITPWSDNRVKKPGYYWVPNTNPSTNCGIEIRSIDENNCVLDLFQINPENTSPSKPKNVIIGNDQNVRMEWDKNLEPDLDYYKVYKKYNDSEYNFYDSSSVNYYTDLYEVPNNINDTSNYVYYKITSYDKENKESTYSSEIKVSVQQSSPTKIVKDDKLNNKFYLEQNYPNPFNPSTTVRYTIPKGADISLKVYDVLGSLVEVLVDEVKLAGSYEVVFNSALNGNNYASGVYIFKLTADDFVEIKKGLLLK